MLSLLAFKNTFLLGLILLFSCENPQQDEPIVTGANQVEKYIGLLEGKRVGVVANQTSVLFKSTEQDQYTHLVDSLLEHNIRISKVFAPEHGFRGKADAGEHIVDGVDQKTGLPIISLYGSNKKPSEEQLKDIDVMVFDIQDVGVRFYTYISTMHYIMEACAEQNIPLLVLDRPNPNGYIVDGPILEEEFKSFVGMHPIPVLHGMTIGEYAQMINGEKWLKDSVQCNLTVVQCLNYTRNKRYSLPIKPSPNLPNDQAINLYPSLCFFEGTDISVGRGTNKQFQVFGHPSFIGQTYSFTPLPNEGAKDPKHNGKMCYGKDLSQVIKCDKLEIKWLQEAYELSVDKTSFFNSFFVKLAGTEQLREQIENGASEEEIRKTWAGGLSKFKQRRTPYLIYSN